MCFTATFKSGTSGDGECLGLPRRGVLANDPCDDARNVSDVSLLTHSQDSAIVQNDNDNFDLKSEGVLGLSSTTTRRKKEECCKAETEMTRLNFLEVVGSLEVDYITRAFAAIAAELIYVWQCHAREVNPTSHQIDFGCGQKLSLLMVLAILPERVQNMIRITDQSRSPSDDGEEMSWLHEDTMNVIVGLCCAAQQINTSFGRGMASMVCDDIDDGWREWYGCSYLEDQIRQMVNDELDTDMYQYPASTEKTMFFYNPTSVHWTLVEAELGTETWRYRLYNSLFQGEKGRTWVSCREQLPLLEKLICGSSGIFESDNREYVAAASAQQNNHYDCGIITVYNAVALLEGREPGLTVDTEHLRLMYLTTILSALRELLGEDT